MIFGLAIALGLAFASVALVAKLGTIEVVQEPTGSSRLRHAQDGRSNGSQREREGEREYGGEDGDLAPDRDISGRGSPPRQRRAPTVPA